MLGAAQEEETHHQSHMPWAHCMCTRHLCWIEAGQACVACERFLLRMKEGDDEMWAERKGERNGQGARPIGRVCMMSIKAVATHRGRIGQGKRQQWRC